MKNQKSQVEYGVCVSDEEMRLENLLALREHILSMADDAYLIGHPEWEAIVNEAKAI